MTINVAFKIPDSVVFATDGLASLFEPDPSAGEDHPIASVRNVEKLLVLSNDPALPGRAVLAMFNGIGSLGVGTIASELSRFDRSSTKGEGPRAANETMARYAQRLNDHLLGLERAASSMGAPPPRPFHLVLAGFDPPWPAALPPHLYEIKWSAGLPPPSTPSAVLQDGEGTHVSEHRYGSFYAGVIDAPARFVDGFDPSLPAKTAALLAGQSGAAAAPGLLEQLIHEAGRALPGGQILPNEIVRDLVMKYTRLILEDVFRSPTVALAESFSTQAAVSYCVFLAFCAYVQENWSPTRVAPPRVGHPLQVACLPRNGPVQQLCGVRLGVDLNEFGGTRHG